MWDMFYDDFFSCSITGGGKEETRGRREEEKETGGRKEEAKTRGGEPEKIGGRKKKLPCGAEDCAREAEAVVSSKRRAWQRKG